MSDTTTFSNPIYWKLFYNNYFGFPSWLCSFDVTKARLEHNCVSLLFYKILNIIKKILELQENVCVIFPLCPRTFNFTAASKKKSSEIPCVRVNCPKCHLNHFRSWFYRFTTTLSLSLVSRCPRFLFRRKNMRDGMRDWLERRRIRTNVVVVVVNMAAFKSEITLHNHRFLTLLLWLK